MNMVPKIQHTAFIPCLLPKMDVKKLPFIYHLYHSVEKKQDF